MILMSHQSGWDTIKKRQALRNQPCKQSQCLHRQNPHNKKENFTNLLTCLSGAGAKHEWNTEETITTLWH